jgi:hypothetical protein
MMTMIMLVTLMKTMTVTIEYGVLPGYSTARRSTPQHTAAHHITAHHSTAQHTTPIGMLL